MGETVAVEDLAGWVGQETGVSDWLTVDQNRINAFADVTGDHQFIHVDVEKAKKTPFGGTIAHGYLTLSLVAYFGQQTSLKVEGVQMAINYGLNSARFLTPVRSGKRIRMRSTLANVTPKGAGRVLMTVTNTIEIEGEEKPALVADSLVLLFT